VAIKSNFIVLLISMAKVACALLILLALGVSSTQVTGTGASWLPHRLGPDFATRSRKAHEQQLPPTIHVSNTMLATSIELKSHRIHRDHLPAAAGYMFAVSLQQQQ
jgi:hypothetical protein